LVYFRHLTHFGHFNIIRYCNRPYKSVNEMNEALIANWNEVVEPEDSVYHLGDFAFGRGITPEDAIAIRRRLNGKIHLIRGNHEETADRIATYPEKPFVWVKDYHELKIGKQNIVLFHYPMRSWHHNMRGAWHLFGHAHGGCPPVGKSFDCGVDSWKYKPIHLDMVALKMNTLVQKCEEVGFKCGQCKQFPCQCDDNPEKGFTSWTS
jgi:calcineurin-like phosphoesterase family protein